MYVQFILAILNCEHDMKKHITIPAILKCNQRPAISIYDTK